MPGPSRRAARLAAVVACAAVTLAAAGPGAVAETGARASARAGPGAPTRADPAGPGPASPVVNARPQSISEAAAAQVPAGTVVVATNGFVPGPASITAWSRRRGARQWPAGVAVQPAGFGASYDPAVAAEPDGSVALVGVATAGGTGPCLPTSSVYLAQTGAGGLAFGTPTVVDDHRQGGGFDDRPIVAAGPSGRLWIGWSHGPDADQCQIVGHQDRVQLSTSGNGGRSFSPPVTLPSLTGGAAYGVQVAPLGSGRAAVSWSELAGGRATIVLCVVRAGSTCAPRPVATSPALPRVLPGASFFSFSLASLVAFHGRADLALAWPVWRSGQGEVVLAVSVDRGASWSTATVAPEPGADLLLPALAAEGSDHLRLLFADHRREGDVVGYQSSLATVDPSTGALALSPAATVVAGRPGPGYFELGEFSFLAGSSPGTGGSGQVVGAVVEGGSDSATLDLLHWAVPAGFDTPSTGWWTRLVSLGGPGTRHRLAADGLAALAVGLAILVVTVAGVLARDRRRRLRRHRRRRTPEAGPPARSRSLHVQGGR